MAAEASTTFLSNNLRWRHARTLEILQTHMAEKETHEKALTDLTRDLHKKDKDLAELRANKDKELSATKVPTGTISQMQNAIEQSRE